MNKKRLLTVMGGTKNILPYSIDFSTLADGSLPSMFTGTTWAISSGKAVNTPTETETVLTDGSLEATYTDGLCGTLTETGGGTPTESADAHAGSKAQQFVPSAFNDRLNFALQAAVAKTFYKFSGWGKYTVNGNGRPQIRLTQAYSRNRMIDTEAYTRFAVVNYMTTTANITPFAVVEANNVGDTVIVDDFALTKLTQSTLFATLERSKPDVSLKIDSTILSSNGCPVGVIARIDDVSSPTYFVIGYLRSNGQYTYCGLEEYVAGVKTVHLEDKVVSPYVEGALFELRLSGTTASIWYNDVQIGVDQTLNSVGQGNKIHGMYSTDSEVSINRFFVVAL